MRRKRVALAVCLTAAAVAIGCSDGVTESRTPIGLYRLASVQGAKLPASDVLVSAGSWVRSGDLVLRSDNSAYGLVRTNLAYPILNFDSYRITGSQIEFTRRDSVVNRGVVAGDSIVMTTTLYDNDVGGSRPLQRTLVFRKTPGDPVQIRDATYVLTIVGNRLLSQQLLPGLVVLYDTIKFTDGVFYRRTRREQRRDVAGNVSYDSYYSLPGTYRGNANYLLLGPYKDTLRTVAAPTRDSLILLNGVLTLRSWASNGDITEDRYEKRP